MGFIAHMDTATDITGENVKPAIIENYDGVIVRSKPNITEEIIKKGKNLKVK